MAEEVAEAVEAYKIWKNPARRGEPVEYLGEVRPPAGRFYFTASDLRELGFGPGRYTIRAPERANRPKLFSVFEVAERLGTGMIDVRKIEQEAAQWGIPVLDRMELDVQMFGNVDVFGDPVFEDGPDEEWRGQVSQVLVDHDLISKAGRYLECCRYAHLYECDGPHKHRLFAPIRCDLRFCSYCAPRQFARLIGKYEPVLKAACARPEKGFLLREITLTSRNTGSLTSEQIKKFNRDVKKTLKILMAGVKGWGAIWCDEVGFGNTNLHAHILLYGPYVSQARLAEVWKEVSGHEVVWIAKAQKSGGAALIYMLKYVSKPPSKAPEQIGLLEVAFHGTRRVHALGVFFNHPASRDHESDGDEWKTCPHCGADLSLIPDVVRIEKAILSGRTFIGTRNTERRKAWIN